jgi:hypothetical protein
MSVDVNIAEGGTATSEKRNDPLDDWSTTNAAGRPHTHPSPTQSEVDPLWGEIAEKDLDLLCSESPGECFGSTESVGANRPNYAPSNPGSPTGSHPGPTGGSPLPPLPHPEPSEDRFPSTPGWSVNSGTLSTGHQPTPPQSPTGGSPLPPLPHPGPSEDRFPSTPGFSANTDTLSSTGHQPTPPQSPTSDSPLSPLPHSGSSEDRSPSPPGSLNRFLDDLLKGKIKRRISGSDTVNSAQWDQRDSRPTNIPT